LRDRIAILVGDFGGMEWLEVWNIESAEKANLIESE
jgi:hypothetical protein